MSCFNKAMTGTLAGAWLQAATAVEAPIEFESRFLRPGQAGEVDVRAFALPSQVLPGDYWLQVQVNGQSRGRLLVTYQHADQAGKVIACFDRALLQRLGVAVDRLLAAGPGCQGISQWMPEAAEHLDFAEQRLALDIPQAWLARTARDQVDADLWDAGVNAAFSGYDLALFNVASDLDTTRTRAYAGFANGANLGAWQWRQQGNLSSDGGYQTLSHYLQREVAPWGAQLRLGQLGTPGDLLEAVQMRGVHVFSDDRMLPASQRGFAPVVRGVARGNARVAVRQGARLLREVVVPPGPYVIDDLYAASLGGDLQVTVSEADGSEQHYTVTNAAAPLALRAGQSRFGLAAGQLHDRQLPDRPGFVQGTWQHGLNDTVTAYGGGTLAADYRQLMLGAALNTAVGAVGLDLSRGGEGGRWRLSYGTLLADSDTRLSLSYQQATGIGYRSLHDAYRETNLPHLDTWRERSRGSISLSQPLGTGWGQLNASAWQASGWGQDDRRQGYSLNYSHHYGALGYGLSATRERDRQGLEQTQWLLNLTLPLGGRRGSLTGAMLHSDQGSQLQAGYRNGTERLDYGVSAAVADRSRRVNAYAGWREPFGHFNASVGQGDHSRQLSTSARGAVVAHPGGVTWAPPLGETFAVVQVPDAAGARVTHGAPVQVNRQGHAIVPNLSPYQLNRIDIDPHGLPLHVELATNSQQVVPRAGAVPLLRYPTRSGRTALIELRLPDDGVLPFGARVMGPEGQPLGVVGQASRVLARGLQPQGQLHVQWGEQGELHCTAHYALSETGTALHTLQAVCLPSPGEP
ncbi:fimbria/pilus outer membrane usher protein [Pseudomonas sp. TE3610]